MRRIYLDTNVFISWVDTELGKGLRGLFAEAGLFMDKVKAARDTIILSDWFFAEVKRVGYWTKAEVIREFERNGVNVELVVPEERLNVKEWQHLGVPRSDAAHVAIAVHARCDCIVTFNVRDFEPARHRIKVCEPKDYS